MVKRWTMAACAAVLAGCRIWAAGDDPAGRDLMPRAQAVLTAVNQYARANGKGPPELQALVPDYLKALPAQPALDYSAKRGTLVFNYSTSWPPGSTSACQAKIGDSAFRCEVYN
jgi:hypothetical protein